jgi:copper chaperone NosL
MNNRLTVLNRILCLVAALSLIAVIFLPIWRIELDAPQYPEGLALMIYADKLAGDVEVINGLNHYIGMRTLHTEDFVEFTVLPYIIAALSLFGLLTVIINRRWFFFTWAGFFILFGIISMIDFYRWNYNYGHNLDPTAPIQVPGMSYQPPIIGFKQLLNFGAYSIPAAGGMIFLGVGVVLLIGIFLEVREIKRGRKRRSYKTVAAALATLILVSCESGPRSIKIGEDACSFCKMTISDKKFGAELVSSKGKVFVFDDLHCVGAYIRANEAESKDASVYVTDFASGELISKEKTIFWKSEQFRSPMGSNIAGFSSKESATKFIKNYPGTETNWEEVVNQQ